MKRDITISNIYEIAINTMNPAEIDHHYSDLYLKCTPVSKDLVNRIKECHARLFIDNINGQLWYDIPFAYTPYWNK